MVYYLGIDPGKQGAFVIMDGNSKIVEMIGTPLLGKEYDKKGIRDILLSRDFVRIGLEKPNVMLGVGKSVVASLSHCVGLIEGMLVGLSLPHVLVAPKEWQKECWKHVKIQKNSNGKGNDTKATSALAGTALWTNVDFKITNKGNKSKDYNDGFIDAALIAEYARRIF